MGRVKYKLPSNLRREASSWHVAKSVAIILASYLIYVRHQRIAVVGKDIDKLFPPGMQASHAFSLNENPVNLILTDMESAH